MLSDPWIPRSMTRTWTSLRVCLLSLVIASIMAVFATMHSTGMIVGTSLFAFPNGGQSFLGDLRIVADNVSSLRVIEHDSLYMGAQMLHRLNTMERQMVALTRASGRCERGWATSDSGRCEPADCTIANSNGRVGDGCACLPGFHGNLTWSGDAWRGSCATVSLLSRMHFGSITQPIGAQWMLALNIDTSDGNHVNYNNNDFWQDGQALGGAVDNKDQAFTHDFKDTVVFNTQGVHQVLIVVHDEGRALGWRRWRTIDGTKSLQGYFMTSNSCPGGLSFEHAVHLASETIDADEGSLDHHEPLVVNKAGAGAPCTNTDLWINAGPEYNDFYRLTTVSTNMGDTDSGFGLGSVCEADRTSGADKCADNGYPQSDGQMHIDGDTWHHGRIGADNKCTGCSYGNTDEQASGLDYDYAIFVLVGHT